jgi:RNA polymerase sigma-70 factor (ECF subfamily)
MTFSDAASYDKQALISLYDQHSPGLFRYAYRMLGNKELAEECVSETFSRFIQALNNSRGPSDNVQGYLYRVAHNWITDQYRRQPQAHLSLDPDGHVDPSGNPSHIMNESIERDRVRNALLRLPYDQQRVVELRFLEDLSHEEVAQVLGKSIEATRALQYRALMALRKMLIERNEEGI